MTFINLAIVFLSSSIILEKSNLIALINWQWMNSEKLINKTIKF